MIKNVLIVFLLVIIPSITNAQIHVDNAGNVRDLRQQQNVVPSFAPQERSNLFGFDITKFTFGGNFGMQFGNYTLINISPQIGYNFTNHFTAGLGMDYSHFNKTRGRGLNETNYKAHYVGMNVFGRYYPLDHLVLSLQPEGHRMWKDVKRSGEKLYSRNKFVGSILVGGGMRYDGLIIMVQYDIVQNSNSPYGNGLFYTIGYSFNI